VIDHTEARVKVGSTARLVSPARIRLDGVSQHYRRARYPTLTNVSLTLEHDGSTLAIAGPSGSGKSTLLSIIGGLMQPSSGNVAGIGTTGTPCQTLDAVAWVFQTTNALPRRTALDNAALGAHSRLRRPDAFALAAECLAKVGLAAHAASAARNLSGGELQRLGVARALATNRPFMILDEPTGQLDNATSTIVLDAIFAQTDVTMVIASHDPAIMERCDTVYTVIDGQVIRR
jgi:ABC-type lipoprotein export system ATPase subunit